MASSSSRKKRMVNVEDDRLSSLPDDLIHKILSFIGIKDAIETSSLSSRWRFIWISMPYLSFSTQDFYFLAEFSKFVTHVLSRRNNQIDVFSVKLSFRGKANQVFVKKILNYAFSHNVQEMTVTWLPGKNKLEFPLCLFKSRSLSHLTLVGTFMPFINATSTWELPSLITLHLKGIIFSDEITDKKIGLFSKCSNLKNLTLISCAMKTNSDNPDSDIIPMSALELPSLTTLRLYFISLHVDNTDKSIGLFSKCANLKNLTLNDFHAMGSTSFRICHPGLFNLTLERAYWNVKAVYVVAPQLQNLTIRDYKAEHVISAPQLASLNYRGSDPLQLSTDGFHSLEKADICIPSLDGNMLQIVRLLQQLHSVKFLTLNTEIVKRLSSCVELISHQPSPFANLERLKIYPDSVSLLNRPNEKVVMSNEVKNYLLDGSPSATFTMVSNEEITALKNAKSARKFMRKLQVHLGKMKEDSDTNTVNMDKGKTPNVNQMAQLETGTQRCKEKQIKRYWKDLKEQMAQDKVKTCQITSMLTEIEGFMTNLPPSQRVEMQAMFSRLCAEADITMTKILDDSKIQFDKMQSHLRTCFHDLPSTSQPSS